MNAQTFPHAVGSAAAIAAVAFPGQVAVAPDGFVKVDHAELREIWDAAASENRVYNGHTDADLRAKYGDENVIHVAGDGWYKRAPSIDPVADAAPVEPESVEPAPMPVVTTRQVCAAITGDRLAAAVLAASHIIERRNTIPILSNVLLSSSNGTMTVEGTDLDMAVRVTVPCEGDDFEVTLPADTLAKLMKRKTGADIWLYGEERTTGEGESAIVDVDSVSVEAGKAKLDLHALPASDFPRFVEPTFSHRFELPADRLTEALQAVEFAISTEETRYYLNGIYCHFATPHNESPRLRIVATDGHRLARFDPVGVMPGADMESMPGIIIPRQAVAAVLSLIGCKPDKKGRPAPTVTVHVSDTKIRFMCGDIVITSKLIDGTFPEYERVIPQGNDKVLTVASGRLADAMETVMLIATERGRAVRLSLSPNRLALTCNNPDMGSATEEIDAAYEGDGMEIGFNSRYLLDVLEHLAPGMSKAAARKGEHAITMRLADAGSPTIFQSDTGPTIVLMPMRV